MKTILQRRLFLASSALTLSAFALSCAPKSPELGPTTPVLAPSSVQAKPEAHALPKVDILFVIDNAEFMQRHQENLARNIDKFATVFEKSSGNLDFHIGVTSLFDGTRWVKGQPGCDYDNGELRKLKRVIPDPANPGQSKEEVISNRNFVTNKDTNLASILKPTLMLGQQPFSQCGYKFEEEFGPVRAALSEPMLSGANAGFYRPDAELAVIFVSDADDETQTMSADQMAFVLMNAKQNMLERLSVIAVTTDVDNNLPNGQMKCPRDNDGPPVKLHQLVENTALKDRGHYLNLCDEHFGDELAKQAEIIRKRALTRLIPLAVPPQAGSIKVSIGGTLVLPGPSTWLYNTFTKSIVVNPDLMATAAAGTEITVDYVAVDPTGDLDHDRVHVNSF